MEYQFLLKLILNRKHPLELSALRITVPVLAQCTAVGNRKRMYLNLEMKMKPPESKMRPPESKMKLPETKWKLT
jgi:hypothetical protein